MEGVPGAAPVNDPELVAYVQQKCQHMCGWKG